MGFQTGAVFVAKAFERSRGRGVKATMARVRVMLTLLLPTLCLAEGQCVLGPVGGYTAVFVCASFSATRQGEHRRMPDARSFEQVARLLNRRVGTQSGPGGFPVPMADPEVQLAALGPVCLSAFSSAESLALAQCWQFRWRTALEPRAPSSVS